MLFGRFMMYEKYIDYYSISFFPLNVNSVSAFVLQNGQSMAMNYTETEKPHKIKYKFYRYSHNSNPKFLKQLKLREKILKILVIYDNGIPE